MDTIKSVHECEDIHLKEGMFCRFEICIKSIVFLNKDPPPHTWYPKSYTHLNRLKKIIIINKTKHQYLGKKREERRQNLVICTCVLLLNKREGFSLSPCSKKYRDGLKRYNIPLSRTAQWTSLISGQYTASPTSHIVTRLALKKKP